MAATQSNTLSQSLPSFLPQHDRPRASGDILSVSDRLSKGIWPQRIAIWMAAFYVALFIIRPWEEMLPFLADIHFERFYALAMVAVVLLTSKFRGVFTLQTASVLFFLFALSLSAVLAVDSTVAWEPWYVYVTLIVFYFILVLVIRTPYELLFMVTCYLVSMGIYLAKS